MTPEGAERERRIRRAPLVIAATAIASLIVGGSVFFLSKDEASDPGEELCWSLVSPKLSANSEPLTKCGDALESSMTGRPAGEDAPQAAYRHSAEEVRMTERVIKAYTESETTIVPEEIRQNLANALTHYTSDVSNILQITVDYSDPAFSTEPNDLSVSVVDLGDFILKLGADPDAFDIVYESQFDRIVQQVGTLTHRDFTSAPAGNTDRPLGLMRQSGRATGILHKLTERGSFEDPKKYGFSRLRSTIEERAENVGVSKKEARLQNLYRAAEDSFLDWS